MPKSHTDFLLVGQGIAGSILTHTLQQSSYSVRVIDNNQQGSASQVAAGIINPITGHRLNITDHFDRYFSVAQRCYKAIEQQHDGDFFRAIEQTRLIKNAGQASYFQQRLGQAEYQSILSHSNTTAFSNTDFGCAHVANTAAVDTVALVECVKQALLGEGRHHSQRFDYSALVENDRGWQYQKWQASKVIFCEGYQAIHNPWLKDLPFKLAKGEILTVTTQEPNRQMLSWGNWLVPTKMNDSSARLGSNYTWNDLSLSPDPNMAAGLLDSLEKHTGQSASVTDHKVGIRPTTVKRQPFVGPLSSLRNAYCFNGFGSKGCLIIPWYAELLSQHLLSNTKLPREVTQWL